MADIQEKHSHLVSDHEALVEEMKKNEQKQEDLQNELQTTEERAKNAEISLQEKQQLISTLQDKEDQVKCYISKLRDEITQLTHSNKEKDDELDDKLANKDSEIETVRNNYENQINTMYIEVERVQNLTKGMIEEHKQQQTLIESLTTQIKEIEKDNGTYQSANTDLLLRIKDVKKESEKEIETLKESHKRQLESYILELKDLKDKAFEFTHRDLQQQKKIVDMEKEMMEKRRQEVSNLIINFLRSRNCKKKK